MLIYTDRLKIRVVRNEPGTFCVFIQFELLERIFAVDIGYNKIAVLGLQTAVHYHDVAIQNPCVPHRIAFYMRIKSSLGVRRHLACEVNPLPGMVGSRRRKTGVNRLCELQRQLRLLRICDVYQLTHLCFCC